jgi:hypothetical protein
MIAADMQDVQFRAKRFRNNRQAMEFIAQMESKPLEIEVRYEITPEEPLPLEPEVIPEVELGLSDVEAGRVERYAPEMFQRLKKEAREKFLSPRA